MVNTLYLPEIREMLAENDAEGLAEFCEALHPARTADFMDGLTPDESWRVLAHADHNTRAAIFGYFSRERQVEMLETLDREEMAEFLSQLPSDERVDVLEDVDDKIEAELLPLVPTDERREILRLQSYEDETAGALMTTEVLRLSENMTKSEALETVRKWSEDAETVYYLYVVDDEDHLRGVVSFRVLFLAKSDQKIADVMDRHVVSVNVNDDQEVVAQRIGDFDLLAIPVVDTEDRLVGIITHDDVLDVLRDEATEDAHMAGAISPLEESYLETGLITLSWKRGFWLTILFFSGLLTTTALTGYQTLVAEIPWLVVFIPLVISCGGNTGNQSATLIITALTTGDVKLKDWLTVVRRELAVGMVLGFMLAALGFMIAYPSAPSTAVALVVPVTLVMVAICGTLTGSLLPLLFRRLGLDPALMSNPFVAVVMDILGILIYMNVAQILIAALLEH